MSKYSVVAYLARPAGLEVFEQLLADDRFSVTKLFTHRRDPSGHERPEYAEFYCLCHRDPKANADIPIIDINSRREADKYLTYNDRCDYLLSCSWKYLISPAQLKAARIAAINLHRGKLPKYAGAEPVRRALEDGEKSVTITAHRMTDVIDYGEVLAETDVTIEHWEKVEWIKHRIIPLYWPTFLSAIQ